MNAAPKIFDITWLTRITFADRDRPTSTWLPPGQRIAGRSFNDPERPEWMDELEWDARDRFEVEPVLRTADLRLKRILCEGASLAPAAEVFRSCE